MIELHDFSYEYPGAAEPALRAVDLQVREGEFCAVVGANGAGKSTLCYALSGFIPHFYRGRTSGSIAVAGFDVLSTPLSESVQRVGLVFDDPFNQITGARFTVREEVGFGLENLGVPKPEMDRRIEAALAGTGLLELKDRSPYALSGGQQQRLAIASVLAMQPQVLVLDEPTSHLDPTGSRQVLEVLQRLTDERGTTVVLVAHNLEWLAERADRVLLLENGAVRADGSPREVLSSTEAMRCGLRLTDFTLVAREASARQIVADGGPLPVTLEQALDFLS